MWRVLRFNGSRKTERGYQVCERGRDLRLTALEVEAHFDAKP